MNVELLAANLTAHWIQAGLLSTSALLALLVLRVKEPRLKLAVLHGVLVVTLLLPWIEPWRSLQPVLPGPASSESSAISVEVSNSVGAQPVWDSALNVEALLLIAVAAGTIVRLLWIAFGLFYVHRLLHRARSIHAPDMALSIEERLGISARYVEHSTAAGPSTFGIFRPTIALPLGFTDLAPGFQRAVVCHELLHVKRRDTLVSLLEEVLVAMFWFHPLIWLVRHQIRVAREQAVDATVLHVVGDRSGYVRCLVEMAGHDLMPHLSRGGAAMIRSRELRARVNAIVQEVRMSRLRRLVVSMTVVGVMAIAAWLAASYAPLQALQEMTPTSQIGGGPAHAQAAKDVRETAPLFATAMDPPANRAAQGPAASEGPRKLIKVSYADYPSEALEKGISGTLTVNITINPAGQVSTAAVTAGPLELRTSAFKAAMGLTYAPGSSTTATTVYVEYRLDRQSWGVRIAESPVQIMARALADIRTASQQLTGRQQPSGAYRVGGNIRPPLKIKDAPPVYPAEALTANVQGVVILETTIDSAGRVSDATVLRSIPLLDQAAIDAVKQWEYEPTLLNGQPVPVVMTVTVNFVKRQPLRDYVELNITTPNGGHPALTIEAPTEVGTISIPGAFVSGSIGDDTMVRFGFAAAIDATRSPAAIKVSVFQATDTGLRRIGTVDLTLGGGTVYSTTTPSFGIEAVRLEKQ